MLHVNQRTRVFNLFFSWSDFSSQVLPSIVHLDCQSFEIVIIYIFNKRWIFFPVFRGDWLKLSSLYRKVFINKISDCILEKKIVLTDNSQKLMTWHVTFTSWFFTTLFLLGRLSNFCITSWTGCKRGISTNTLESCKIDISLSLINIQDVLILWSKSNLHPFLWSQKCLLQN